MGHCTVVADTEQKFILPATVTIALKIIFYNVEVRIYDSEPTIYALKCSIICIFLRMAEEGVK
jgi:hypothetical protein